MAKLLWSHQFDKLLPFFSVPTSPPSALSFKRRLPANSATPVTPPARAHDDSIRILPPPLPPPPSPRPPASFRPPLPTPRVGRSRDQPSLNIRRRGCRN
ncbi:unnamed protein product [Closterium sp. NIES-54]